MPLTRRHRRGRRGQRRAAVGTEFHRGSFGEMTLRADGQVLAQQDIRIEREGATYG